MRRLNINSSGIYIHIPFCKSRCSYCDFATDIYRDGDLVERYVDAVAGEIDRFAGDEKTGVDTIYFGGGTPSLLSVRQIEKILIAVNNRFTVSVDAEITMEMNPATVTPETLAGYRSLGVNRASFGVQTFNELDLKLLARGHNAADALNTFKLLRAAGFDNVSFDLIAGLPGQTIADWTTNLSKAIELGPEHLSLYLLEIHEGTPLDIQLKSSRRQLPDDELSAEMYEIMIDRLVSADYEQYEISNFARPGYHSRHNTKYWLLDAVFGFGVSAHSFDGEQRYANERTTSKYLELIESGQSAEVFRETINAASEFVFLGLRLTDGIDLNEFEARFGRSLSAAYGHEIKDLIDKGLLEKKHDKIGLTRLGMLYSNEVFALFV